MRKIIVGGAAASLGVATALATGVLAGGNGANRSGVSPQTSDPILGSQCEIGDGAASNGFVMFNAPGKPGDPRKLIGELALKNGPANTTFTVWVASNDGNETCMPEGSLTTNTVGNGNAHIADPSLGGGTFYVVLQDEMGNEAFASGPVTVN